MSNRAFRDTEETEREPFANFPKTDDGVFFGTLGCFLMAVPPCLCVPHAYFARPIVLGGSTQCHCQFHRFRSGWNGVLESVPRLVQCWESQPNGKSLSHSMVDPSYCFPRILLELLGLDPLIQMGRNDTMESPSNVQSPVSRYYICSAFCKLLTDEMQRMAQPTQFSTSSLPRLPSTKLHMPSMDPSSLALRNYGGCSLITLRSHPLSSGWLSLAGLSSN